MIARLLRKLSAGSSVPPPPSPVADERAFAPHCDQSVLHAPGVCKYCDDYQDWQELRLRQRIGFTDHPAENVAPCPSTWFRSAEIRNRWAGNRAVPR